MSTRSSIDPAAFRGALGSFATGVTIVTTHDQGVDVGLTASSFNSVSLNPPMVLWSLSKDAASRPYFESAAHFAVHVLTEAQVDLSARFAKKGADKFAGLQLERGEGSIPLLQGCSARFECRKSFAYDGGDHIIFVGEVVSFQHSPAPPLVFHGGRYATAAPKGGPMDIAKPKPGEGLAYWVAAAYFAWRAPALALSEELDLAVAERRLLAALLEQGERSLAQINADATSLDPPVKQDAAERLETRGLVKSCAGGALALTAAGRSTIISLIAARKAAEAAAGLELGPERSSALCGLLRDFVEATNAGGDERLLSQMRRFKQLEGYLGGQD